MIFVVLIYSAFLHASTGQSVIVSTANQDEYQTIIRWYWEDEFTPDEKEKVRTWLSNVENGVESTIGPFPFDLHFHIHRRTNSSEPVPWANTRRYSFGPIARKGIWHFTNRADQGVSKLLQGKR